MESSVEIGFEYGYYVVIFKRRTTHAMIPGKVIHGPHVQDD